MSSCCGRGRNSDDFDVDLIRKYVICAPKETVYDAFIDYVWYKNNPFMIRPHLIDTECEELDIDYSQRLLLCKQIRENVHSLKKYHQIKYTVSSWLMPTSHYNACVEFKDYYDSELQIQCTLLEWTAQLNFRWSSCTYCFPFAAVLFRKMMELCYDAMANSLKAYVETKKQQ